MKLILEFRDSYCTTKQFIINGKDGDIDDFGEKYDRKPSHRADDYSCGYMQFIRKEPTQEVLEKYQINKSEYAEIALYLEDGLSFGCCSLCS